MKLRESAKGRIRCGEQGRGYSIYAIDPEKDNTALAITNKPATDRVSV